MQNSDFHSQFSISKIIQIFIYFLFFQDLPPSLAHALISILCNVKLWLNYRAVPQLFTPVRTNALRYMCELSDAELRQQHPRQIGKIKEIF